MNDHDFIADMQARCAAQLAGTGPVIPPPNPTPAGVVMLRTPDQPPSSVPPAPTPGGSPGVYDYAQGVTYAFAWPTGGGQLSIDTANNVKGKKR